jgi:hypothetical protein
MLSLLICSSAELKSAKTAFDSMGSQLIALLGLIFGYRSEEKVVNFNNLFILFWLLLLIVLKKEKERKKKLIV